MTNTPNKGYNNQATNTNTGTWGVVLNGNFTTIDQNLGGTLTLSVAGNSDVALTSAQAESLIYNFTGALSGNINIVFPAAGGLYFINNQTTGAFSLTIQAGSSTQGFLIPQGTQVPVYVDNSTTPPTVGGAAGTPYVFALGAIAGTANALTASTTFPSNFVISTGTLITFVPTATNTTSATLAVDGGAANTLQKLGATGVVNLQAGDLFAGTPVIAYWNGSVWVCLNILYFGTPTQVSSNFSLSFANWLQPIVATNTITITVPQVSTSFTYYFSLPVTAGAGPVTWAPFGTDVIWVNGVALSAGASFIQPQGSNAKFTTDANGNIYLAVDNSNLSSTYTKTQYGTFAGTVSGQLTGTIASAVTGVTQATNDSTTKMATTAFVNPGAILSANGYVELPSGLIMQWGTTGNIGSTATVTITLPLTFPTNFFAGYLTATGSFTNPSGTTGLTILSTSQFSVTCYQSTTVNFYWFAIGN